jgi:Bacterial regulatory helix-turn-helix proteins, AraC family
VPRIIRAKDVLSVFYFLCNMPMRTVCPHQQSKLKNRSTLRWHCNLPPMENWRFW